MANTYFQFKEFIVHQDRAAMKVSTDACIFGAWMAGICAEFPANTRLIDVGTGTGLLSLMVAQQYPGRILGVEIDPEAAKQAEENFKASPWKDRLSVKNQDARGQVDFYDIVISNPPFFENDLRGPSAERNQARHADTLSLWDLCKCAWNHADPGGIFGVIIPYHRLEDFLDGTPELGFALERKLLVRQTPNHGFFRALLLMKAMTNDYVAVDPLVEELTIMDNGDYTPAFKNLLKPYYLHL